MMEQPNIQKQTQPGQPQSIQTHKQQSQTNLGQQNVYQNHRPQHSKNETNNFATVTANTGNMIVSNQPLTAKIDPQMSMSNSQPVKHNQRMNNQSNCFSEPKTTVANTKAKTQSQSSKQSTQNHHTLQCISDINEFKHKINMVLQTQAFPSKLGQHPIDTIPTKQIAANAPGSLNPSSRIGYSNNKHESPTPNLNKNHFFQKRKVNKQNGLNQLGQMYDIMDSKNEQIVNSAFQSFKQNLKQQHQQFIKSSVQGGSQAIAANLMEQHQAQVLDNKSQSSAPQETLKLNHHGGTYLLRSQKDKNRNQFQLQYQNAQTNPFQSNGDIPNFKMEAQLQHKMLNGHVQADSVNTSITKKSQISNMMQHQNNYGPQVPQTQSGNQKNSQRRKLLLEYGNEHTTPDGFHGSSKVIHKQPSPDALSSNNSRHKRSSVFSQNDLQKLHRPDVLEQIKLLSIELLDDKDRENLKIFATQYLADLKVYLEHKNKGNEEQQNGIVNGKLTTELANQNMRNSKEGFISGGEKQNALNTMMNNPDTKLATPQKEVEGSLNPISGNKSIHDESAEKFKQNEKNLKEERLRKESKMDISLGVENNLKMLKANTPGQAGPGEALVHDGEQEKAGLPLEAGQEPAGLQGEINTSGNLKRNISQKQFTSIKTQDMTESEGSLMFKTENNRLRKMLASHEDQSPNTTQEQKKVDFLAQLIEDLDKPKNQMPLGKAVNQLTNRTSQLHYGHANDKAHQEALNVIQALKEQSPNSEWIAGITPIKMFLASLNCTKPTPQQINVMNNSKQRLDLFKILQAREHVKFTNIQSEKMLQLHQKLEDELESRNRAQNDLKGNDSAKFADYVAKNGLQSHQRKIDILNQYQQKQIQSIHNLQQLKNMRKQQQNDQKAFSIFQMNELAQFRSMSDGQQKQILLNNLQQGKFDEFENILDPIVIGNGAKTSGNQTSQSTADGTSLNNSSKMSKNGARSLEQTNDILKKNGLRGAVKPDEFGKSSYDIKTEDSAIEVSQRRSMMNSGQENIGSKENITSQGPGSGRVIRNYKNNIQSEQATLRPSGVDNLHVIRKKELDLIKKNFEASESQFQSVIKDKMLKQQKIKIFYQQMNEAFVNYIHNNKFYQQIQNAAVAMENMIPYLPKGGAQNDYDEKVRARIKARQSMGLNNIASNKVDKDKQIDRSKSKQNINPKDQNLNDKKNSNVNAIPEQPAQAQAENKDANAAEAKKEEGEGEDIVQEVKKPRYFPPKKLPNPFENAAKEQEQFLQARKEALAKYSQLSKNRFKQDETAPLKYVIRPGNNSKLIFRVFEKSGRLDPKYDNEGNTIFPGWETADDYYDSLYNFKWKPTSGGIKYDLISKHGLKQLVNHVKGHFQLTTKDNLFINLKTYYESQKVNIYDMVPLTIVLDYLKDDVGDKVETFSNILKLVDKQIDQGHEIINQKLQEMQIQREKTVKSQYKISRCMHDRQNLWLLKPTGFNRGIGIHIFQNFDQLKDIMCTYYGIGRGAKDKASIFQTHKQNHVREYVDQNGEKQHRNFSFVIQKLIERPLLYLNRKFDIRTWVLLNSADGKVYYFQESYARTSSKEYREYDPDLDSEENIFMQLTNNAVQKEGADYGKFEEGNIISLDTLFNYIASVPEGKSKTKAELKNNFLDDAKRFIVDSMKSVKGKITLQKYTFELFGYDFIIDEDLNTVLIEVNTNPCLEESNRILKCMLPRMVDDMMNITMDPLFYPSETNKYKSAFPLPGNVFHNHSFDKNKIEDKSPHPGFKDTENLFKHIYTLEA